MDLSKIELKIKDTNMFISNIQANITYNNCFKKNTTTITIAFQDLKSRSEDRNIECPVCHPSLNTLAIGDTQQQLLTEFINI